MSTIGAPLNVGLLRRGAQREARSMLGLSIPALCLVAALLIIPITWLISLSFIGDDGNLSFKNYTRIWTDGAYVQIFVGTFQISLWVTSVCILLGYPVSYTFTLFRPHISNLLLLAVLVPFWTSLLVRTYAWLVLLQRRGIVNTMLVDLGVIDQPLRLVHNMTGTIIGMVHVMLPFLILPLYASMRAIDPNLARAAASLGSSPTHAFLRVFLPLSIPGLVAGSMLVFVMCLGFYITPSVLGGGNVQMIAQRIDISVSLYPTWGPAAALSVVLLMLTSTFLAVSWYAVRRLRAEG